jgi:hypothetical protein
MLMEYRVRLTVEAPEAKTSDVWAQLLKELTHSPVSRTPDVWPNSKLATFVLTFPARDETEARQDAIAYVGESLAALGWMDFSVRVDVVGASPTLQDAI